MNKSRIHNDETTRTRMLLQKLTIEQKMTIDQKVMGDNQKTYAGHVQLTVTITRKQYLQMLNLSIEALQSRLIKRGRL